MKVEMAMADELRMKIPLFQWDINTDSYDYKNQNCLVSPRFSILGNIQNEWQLKLYPRGIHVENEGYFSLFLCNLMPHEMTVTCSFSLWNKGNAVSRAILKNEIFKPNVGRGFSRTFEHSFVLDYTNNVLKDKSLSIQCNIVLTENKVETNNCQTQNKKNLKRMQEFDHLENLMTNPNFSDIKIIAGKKTYQLHRNILTSCSPVFDAMLKNDTEEKILEIKDIRSEVLNELFKYIYCAKVDDIDKIDSELLIAAEKYNVIALKSLCEESL